VPSTNLAKWLVVIEAFSKRQPEEKTKPRDAPCRSEPHVTKCFGSL
jgi:hypothetical protein